MADFQHLAYFACENPARFERALKRYLYALDRMHAETDCSDEMSELLTDSLNGAEDAVMVEPSSSLEQLRVKADILFLDTNSLPPDRHVKAFFADLIRLTGNGPSRVFDPARWLARFERIGGGWVVQDDRAWLMWPEDDRIDDCLEELELRGGRPSVIELIRARHQAKAA